ncbi:replication protein A, subunit RPA32 [Cystobasidium minutum MCA 4210]|uniref:replication protein A, subunit RPA32 n=1 Tax=Cystobasidium minutum MCA 4210 TaxID=1397322 RepID=UPI0034CE136F|eukprot:jgi/Rhomi1/198232/gm1.6446_g
MPGSHGGSPGSKKQSSHTYRPVTIKQLHDAFQSHPDAPFNIDDVDIDHVVFVGTIVNIAKSATNVSSTIEDGTGTIDVRQWIDTADDDTGKMAGIDQGVYVRVMGDLKSFNNRRSVNATSIKAITDFNEIQYHLLETVYVHLYHTRGPPQAGGHGGQTAQRQQQQPQRANGADPYAMNNNNTSAGDTSYAELKPMARKIMQYIDRIGGDNLPEEGLSVDTLARAIPGATVDKIKVELEDLLSDGMLYTTMDDEHVLPTSV